MKNFSIVKITMIEALAELAPEIEEEVKGAVDDPKDENECDKIIKANEVNEFARGVNKKDK